MKRLRNSSSENRRESGARRERRPPRPLDPKRLEEMALAYVARFATSAGKLATYLTRKLREREWEGEQPAGEVAAALVERFVAAGYIDDAGFARARSDSLQRRGFGKRRIVQALGQAGIAGDTVRDALPDAHAGRRAALALARKRRFGPFGEGSDGPGSDSGAQVDRIAARARREKQIAAMLRAGHPLDSARELVNAISIEAAEQWADEGESGPCA